MNAKSWTRQLVRRPDGARRTSRTGGLSSIYRALFDVFKVNGLSGGEGVLWVLRLPDLSLGSLGSANLLTDICLNRVAQSAPLSSGQPRLWA